jgi:hypothetical protein
LTIIGYSIDTLELFLNGPATIPSLGVVGIMLRPLILFSMVRAIQPMRTLRAENPTQMERANSCATYAPFSRQWC